jgi:hypothetical protein
LLHGVCPPLRTAEPGSADRTACVNMCERVAHVRDREPPEWNVTDVWDEVASDDGRIAFERLGGDLPGGCTPGEPVRCSRRTTSSTSAIACRARISVTNDASAISASRRVPRNARYASWLSRRRRAP